jgi:soluble lytic murein transglycosylase-like protein
MLLAGATSFFAPHAGHPPPKASTLPPAPPVTRLAPEPRGIVTVSTEFRLPPELAYEPLILEAADRYRMDPALIRAVIQTESAFEPMAVSTAGAQGLMQLMPALAEELGVQDVFDPRENIMAGARYLSFLLYAHDGNLPLALASYNAGPGTVALYQGVPPFPETERYVKTITEILARGSDRATNSN